MPAFINIGLISFLYVALNSRITDLRADVAEIRQDVKHIVASLSDLDKRVSITEERGR